MQIYPILNADDFGLSPGSNRGTIEVHRDEFVASASLMARTDGDYGSSGLLRQRLGELATVTGVTRGSRS
jgi:YdjC-like protein